MAGEQWAGGCLPALPDGSSPARCLAPGRVLSCPMAHLGGWDMAIARTPWRGSCPAPQLTQVNAMQPSPALLGKGSLLQGHPQCKRCPRCRRRHPRGFPQHLHAHVVPVPLCPAGQTCEIDINECVKSPCRNGATCQNTNGSYRCACRAGFAGRNCDTDIDDCKPSKSRGCSGDRAQPSLEPAASLPVLGLGSLLRVGEPWRCFALGCASSPARAFGPPRARPG